MMALANFALAEQTSLSASKDFNYGSYLLHFLLQLSCLKGGHQRSHSLKNFQIWTL